MANSINEILGKSINSVKELKEEIKRLQDSLVGLDSESKEFKSTSQKLGAAQDELRKVIKAGVSDNLAAKDSIAGMEQEYKKLYNQYKLLSDEQRNSSFGKNMASELDAISKKINSSKQEVGNFSNNVAHYAEDITKAFNGMGISIGSLQKPLAAATTGTKTLGAAFKSLIATPVGAFIMIIVGAVTALAAIFNKASDAINKNEESQVRLHQAMASFQPILDAISNMWDRLGTILVGIIEKFVSVTEKIRIGAAAFTDFLGITKGAKDTVKNTIKQYKDLAKATDDLTIAKRNAKVQDSIDKAEVERLREEASATEDLVEKKRLLEEAKAKQAEIDERNSELAQEENRILQAKASLTANGTAENEKLADSQVKVNNAMATGSANARQYNKQLNSLKNTTKSTTDEAKKAAEEQRKAAFELHQQLIENTKTEIQKTEEKYKKEKTLLEKYNLDTTLLTKQYESDVTKIKLEEYNKQRKLSDTFTSEENEKIRKQYDYRKQLSNNTGELLKVESDIVKQAQDDLDKYEEVANRTKEALSNIHPEVANTLFDKGIIEDATNYEHILGAIDKRIQEQDGDVEELKKAYSALSAITVEGWSKTTEELENAAKALNEVDGYSIKTAEDIENVRKILNKSVSEILQMMVDNDIVSQLSGMEDETLAAVVRIRETEGLSIAKQNEYVKQEEARLLSQKRDFLSKELEDFQGTQEMKLQLMEEYYGVMEELQNRQQELEELNRERRNLMFDDILDGLDSVGSALGTYRSSLEQLIDSEVKLGTITQEQADKKKKKLLQLQAVETALNIVSIAGSTAGGIMKIWQAYAAEKLTNAETAAAAGPAAAPVLAGLNAKSLISAIAQTAGLAATGLAQIAAAHNGYITAKNNMSAESGGGTGAIVEPALIDSSPVQYTQEVQSFEKEQELNRPIWVSVTDLENGLEGRRVRVKESSF